MIKLRRYKLLGDFEKVCQFLDINFNHDYLNSYLLSPFFEYAHTHPAFKHQYTHRFGLWEDGEQIVGIVCYEMELGECFLSVHKDYEKLLTEMLEYAEEELVEIKNNEHILRVWIIDKEVRKSKLLQENGYQRIYIQPVKIFTYDKKFPEIVLPDGFSIISLEDENNFEQINACLWKGFDHGPDPDDDIDCRMLMQSGPNFKKELTTVIKAPNGDYVCYAGMWFNEANKYAYLEPLVTVPEFRKMGLATIALVESMKKTKKLGAKYCFGDANEFYSKIGFKTICYRELWKKVWTP